MNISQHTSAEFKAAHPIKKPAPEVTTYKGYVLVDRGDIVDVVDPVTYRWFSCVSLRSARWSASVLRRFNNEMNESTRYDHVNFLPMTTVFKFGEASAYSDTTRTH